MNSSHKVSELPFLRGLPDSISTFFDISSPQLLDSHDHSLIPFLLANFLSALSVYFALSESDMPAVSESALSIIELMSSTERIFTAAQYKTWFWPSS
jgi:hypothetical protein